MPPAEGWRRRRTAPGRDDASHRPQPSNGQSPPARASRQAWLAWGLGLSAYVVAVFHRSSLGVAGPAAQERFDIGPAVLSLFTVLQLAVYAGLQIPVGLLLDRLGSRRLLVTGALTMAAGQVLLATAPDVVWAVVARVLVGAGDAMTFISVLRLIAQWFPHRAGSPSRRAAVVVQATGILGQLGQVAAAVPLVALLRGPGWTPTFLGAGVVGLCLAGVLALRLRDTPPGTPAAAPATLAQTRALLVQTIREPANRLGFWTHFAAQFSGTVFALLWGYPFLVDGEGRSPRTAGLLLTLLVGVGALSALVFGRLAAGWPYRRSALTFSVVGASAATWGVVLLWPGPAPLPLLVVLVCVLATNGPGSIVGLDYARTENPAARVGSASGVVNVGGFVASLSTIALIGLVLDVLGGSSPSLGDFRLAFCVQYLFWGIGIAGVVRSRRRTRAALAAGGLLLDPLPTAVRRRLHSRQHSQPHNRPHNRQP